MNKITLVRLDGDAKHEVDIPVGETVIGRGPVMQCTDKRVSRTHAKINVSEDGKIELTSMSLNPCYYNDDTVIKQSSSVELKIGDRFSFLQDGYCYCVKASTPDGSTSEEGVSDSDIIDNGVNTENKPLQAEENGVQPGNPEGACNIRITLGTDGPSEVSVDLAGVNSTSDLSGEMMDDSDIQDNSSKNAPMDMSPSSMSKYVPKWLLAATERAKRRGEEPSGAESEAKKVKNGEEVAEEKSPAQVVDASAKNDSGGADVATRQDVAPTSAAQQMSDDSESEELAGVEPSEEVTGRSQSPPKPAEGAARASGGAGKETRSGQGEGATADHTRDRSPVRVSSRDSCKYGSNCYRKNPQHQAEYSHPGDPDYKDDDRPECPYGKDCYRKNPLHKQNYKHTKKTEKPPKKRQRTKKGAPKDADQNSDEDEYDHDDPFLNDDSSDDYDPTDSGSNVSTSEDDDDDGEEEEDTKRMKKEAKRFVRGKRKH